MTAATPFELLKGIASQHLLHAQGLPAQEEIHKTWKGVAYELAGFNMVSPMGQVTEILPVPQFTHIPRVKAWVYGVANVRGRLVPVIDLPLYLGQTKIPNRKNRRLLIVEMGDFIVGLVVNHVHGMYQMSLEQFQRDSGEQLVDFLKPFVKGCFETMAGEFYLFDMQNLLNSEAFMQVANESTE